jgi:hypothetical protein
MQVTMSILAAILATVSTSFAMPAAEPEANKLVARSIVFKAYDYDNFGAPELDQTIDIGPCGKCSSTIFTPFSTNTVSKPQAYRLV